MPTLDELQKIWRTEFGSKSETKSVLETTSEEDFSAIGKAATNLISRWHQLFQRRSELLEKYPDPRSIPKTVQRYHTLLLQEVVTQSMPDIGLLYNLPVRLSVTGLNLELSRFFLEYVLEPRDAAAGKYVFKGALVSKAKPALAESLGHYGLEDGTINWALSDLDNPQEDIDVYVPPANYPVIAKNLDPWFLGDGLTRYTDRNLAFPGGWGNLGGGHGGGSSAGGMEIYVPYIVTKGVGLVVTDLLGMITTAIKLSVVWEHDNGLADDEGHMVVRGVPVVKGPAKGYEYGATEASCFGGSLVCLGNIFSANWFSAAGACGLAAKTCWDMGGEFGRQLYDVLNPKPDNPDDDSTPSGGGPSFVDP